MTSPTTLYRVSVIVVPPGSAVCHYCGLPIKLWDKVIQAKTRNAWAHMTCWYDGPFEREGATTDPTKIQP